MTYSKANIIVVDDTRANLHLLNQLLSEAGYQVRPIPDGKRMLTAVQKNPPDLILLDIMMPKMDGYSVCEHLQAQESTKDIPVIFISALNDTADKIKAFTVGGVDYITKPFQKEEILARINSQLTIQRQKRLLASILNSSLDGIVALQALRNHDNTIVDFHCLLVNPIAAKMVEQFSGKIIGKSLLENFPKIKEEGLFKEYVAVVENNEILHKELYCEHQNIRNWLEISGVKLGDGLAVTFRDITKHKKMELALQHQANMDGLTGVPNRRCFDDYLEKEWQRGINNQQPLSLILCDVDYFKPYNDQYGHLKGDECLVKVAKAINNAINRPKDLVARYGGEEFAAVLPGISLEQAEYVAELIQKKIHQLQIPHEKSQVSSYISISLGVTSVVPTIEKAPRDLICAADQALYDAKKQGRNSISKINF